MARHHKRPYTGAKERYTWFNADTVGPGLGDHESDLPGPVYKRLRRGAEAANHKAYAALRAAEEDFLAAWAEARWGGWKADG
jgi:hypothetical protein